MIPALMHAIQQNQKPRHVAVVVPVAAQEILSDPHATPEQIESAHQQAVEIPDDKHAKAVEAKELKQVRRVSNMKKRRK